MSILFAFAAAFTNALDVITQHVASTAAPAKDKGWRLALYLVRNPLWLFGVGAMICSFVLQAVALHKGRVSQVQSIMVTELVFTLVIGSIWLRRHVPVAAWMSALLTAAGLAVFLVVSEPKGGHPQATRGAWLPALLLFGGLILVFFVLARGGSPTRRAVLYASASGISWALLAVFLKSATDVLATGGVLVTLQQGAIYGVVAAGIVGTISTQAALHHGPLAVSQPLMVTVDPFVSVILGVWLYGEHFEGGPLKIAASAADLRGDGGRGGVPGQDRPVLRGHRAGRPVAIPGLTAARPRLQTRTAGSTLTRARIPSHFTSNTHSPSGRANADETSIGVATTNAHIVRSPRSPWPRRGGRPRVNWSSVEAVIARSRVTGVHPESDRGYPPSPIALSSRQVPRSLPPVTYHRVGLTRKRHVFSCLARAPPLTSPAYREHGWSRLDDRLRALSQVGLFSGCNKQELRAVARLCTPLSVQKDFVLTTRGDPGSRVP